MATPLEEHRWCVRPADAVRSWELSHNYALCMEGPTLCPRRACSGSQSSCVLTVLGVPGSSLQMPESQGSQHTCPVLPCQRQVHRTLCRDCKGEPVLNLSENRLHTFPGYDCDTFHQFLILGHVYHHSSPGKPTEAERGAKFLVPDICVIIRGEGGGCGLG